ncbi:MAG: putative 21 kDa hemolysin protein [Pseudomonadota bacterium]|jgi:osmotically-inducible protein OsmY
MTTNPRNMHHARATDRPTRTGTVPPWPTGTVLLPVLAAALLLAGCAASPPPPPATPAAQVAPSIPDSRVREGIVARWSVPGLDRRLDATVERGRALLTGRARNAEERVEAVRLAWQADGVTEVINEIQLDDSGGIADAATDTWIATRLRYRLFTDAEITSGNFTIDVVNQTVYLLGKARSQQELDRVIAHAREVPRVKQVVNHVRL